MNRMSAQDASFLHIESDSSPMHVGGVSIFEGPAAPVRGCRRDRALEAAVRAALPPGRAVRPVRARAAGVGRRPSLQHRLSPPPHRAPRPRGRRRATGAGRTGDVAEPRPREAAVGDVDRRGTRRGSLGAVVQGPPRDGRRRRRHRPDDRAARPRARADAARRRRPGRRDPGPGTGSAARRRDGRASDEPGGGHRAPARRAANAAPVRRDGRGHGARNDRVRAGWRARPDRR